MRKNYFAVYEKLKLKTLLVLAIILIFNCADAIAQCSNYQVYESIGTALPTSGGTWADNSITYGVGSARTGYYSLTFDAAGDYIRTPQIANPGLFSFWYRRQATSTGTPQFQVQTSPDGVGSWSAAVATTGTFTTTYQQLTVDLGALALTNVYVRIVDTRGSGTAARYVDDIAWTSATTTNTLIPALANCGQTIACGTTYTFTDSGTANDNYNYTVTGTATATDYTITFTPSVGTNKIQMAFSAFDTQSGVDGMVIYNGPNTSSPIFDSGLGVGSNATNCPAGSYYGTTSPGTITSTDATGTITIRFRSDTTTGAAGTNLGWLSSVTCVNPCTTPANQPTSLNFSSITGTSLSGSFTAAATAPSGYLVVRSTSATPPTLTDGTTYAVGYTGLTPGTTTVIQGSALTSNGVSFSDSGLVGNTQYYYYVFSYNNACVGAPYYLTTSPLTNSAVTCPAIPNTVATASLSYSGFTLNWATPTGGSASAITYTVQVTTDAGYTANIPGSPFSIAAPTVTKVITGLAANTPYYYRILASNGCSSAYVSGSVTTSLAPCTTPSNQPTVLTFSSITGTSLNGAFTAAATPPSGYLVVRSTSATAPTLTDGVTYAIGYTGLAPGTTYVIQGSAVTSNAVSFSDTGLAGNTQYYYHVFSYNSGCVGTPYYLATSPLTSSAITCPAIPNTVATASITSTGFTLNWTVPTGGSASAITYTVQVTTDAGYTANIPGSPFSIAAPTVTKVVTGLSSSTTYYYRILASNGCSSAYVSSSVTTSVGNPCTSATTLACATSGLASTTVGSTSYAYTAGCDPSNYGKWFTFVGDGNQTTITSVGTGGFDQEMTISSGSCGSLTNISCHDVGLSNGTETATFTAILGTTYYVYVAYWYSAGTSTDTGTFTISRTCTTPPPPVTNDEPCTAISLTVNSSCSYASYTNAGATATSGVTAPGCASYSGGDVWFSAVVPSNGILEIDTNTGTMLDSGMAIYTGTCSSLTLVACDDDSSTNGAMSYLQGSGLTAGSTVYIRIWEYSNDNQGTFGICVTSPPPPANNDCSAPTTLTVNTGETCTTSTSGNSYGATQSQVACIGTGADDDVWYQFTATGTRHAVTVTPGTMNNVVFQVFSGSCGSLTSIACINNTTGSTAETTTLTGLTIGATYIVRVHSNNANVGTQGTFSICVTTLCTLGSGIGTTTLACINPIAGEAGQNGADPAAMHCSSPSCVNLDVTYLPINQTTNYTVSSIAYTPPYQFSCLANAVSVNVDDVWSPVINLPFNFCFYGNTYTSCVIGSNGTLSFNTSYAGTSSGYEYNNNLPSTASGLFANTIYGVYQDIDPSKGGKVGYELITLTSGCRALVASWSDVPMYYNNSILYTGMLVLYENTNVIDVYIKEKYVDDYSSSYGDAWNYGNGIVGVQNAAGTAAVVAPNRNGLSTNWSATNEAWRFTPSGAAAATTIKWFEGSGTTGTQLSTSSTLNVCPLSTTTYTAEITYTLCTGTVKLTDETTVTVNGGKTWTGLIDTDWNKAGNWNPNTAIPTGTDCVVIPNTTNKPIVSGTSYKALAGTLAVYANAKLTINSSNSIVVTDWVNVNAPGEFQINDSASLVQINNVSNTGNIVYKRTAPSIKGSDYVYWSSPVLNQDMGTIYDATFAYSSGYKYQWNTTVNNGNGASGNIGQGNWQAASGVMARAKGYIIRGSSSFGMPATSIPTTFTGNPFNGNISITVQRGDYTGGPYNGANGAQITNLNDNYNLLGNPYPSAMNALQFLQTNTYHATTNPSGQLLGNVKLWTHGHDPLLGVPNPFYGSFQYNYDANDYLTINYLGSTTPGAPDIIKGGQAFFVQMVDGTANTGTVNFTNSMRLDATNNPYSNSGFYKNGNATNDVIALEKHRIWLDLVDSNRESSGILVGYATDATNDYDTFFDAPTAVSSGLKLFSIIESRTDVFDIQGRTLPFDVNDEIPVGVNLPTSGNYSFAIAKVDGLFETQNIYLKDNLLNITHDLKVSPYQFTALSGVIKDRFKIVYINNALGNPNHSFENNIKVMVNNEVAVSSSNLQMESIVVYNVLGQKLNTYKNINSNYVTLSGLHKNNTTLLLKIKLQTGETVIKKISY
ncbi:fibronectin type III domain-containing protein [Flavobacterium sangjuense]|uniref:Fibronectin type-III domain-containing protein n=1 Tax=Flavobacterium sangjuense TaxID=2518177 RepID=A0A4P7PPN9_9FLAO|nr:fibronectin type III domain-containing protein [Flavobacterium sangjuense]QBZ96628.1 hypothetical protein GS03_00105 [Flavobacterium sangjuense]